MSEIPTTKGKFCFVGVGATHPTRRMAKTEVELAIKACRTAAEDAGIDPADIDGINIHAHHNSPPDTAAIAAPDPQRPVAPESITDE